MKVSYFKKQLSVTQDLFSQIYQNLIVFDIRTRNKLIFSICHIGILQAKIDGEGNKDNVRKEIREFIRKQNIINDYLKKIKEGKKRYEYRN